MKEKAISYPATEGEVSPYYDNAESKLTGGLALKYGVTAKMANISAKNLAIPIAINKSEADNLTAHTSHNNKVDTLHDSKVDMLEVLHIINRHPLLDEDDAIDLGMRAGHLAPDPKLAKPRVAHITMLPEKIVLDFILGHWDGVFIDGSYDGIAWTPLDKIDSSPFKDFRTNRVLNVVEVRHYRLRFYVKNEKIGVYSDPAKAAAQIYPPSV